MRQPFAARRTGSCCPGRSRSATSRRCWKREGATTVDLGEVKEVDSSALALLLAWLREAKAAGRSLVFANLPESLQTIARLYGVQDLLPVAR